MAEIKKLDDEEMGQVSGGESVPYDPNGEPVVAGLFSNFTDSKFKEAGVEIVGPGWLYNDSYILKATGEVLSTKWATWAVHFYIAKKRRARCLREIQEYYEYKQQAPQNQKKQH